MPTKSAFFLFALALLPASASLGAQQNFRFITADGEPVSGLVIELQHQQASATQDNVAIIDQIDRTFVPMIKVINPGQSVSFPNSDNVRHHVYSFSEIKQFSTPLYANEKIDPVKFDQAGIAVLGCNIHDSMVGYVFVSPWLNWYQSDQNGLASVAIPDGVRELHLWHPWLQTPNNRKILRVDSSTDQEITVQLDIRNPQQTLGFRALRQAEP